MNPPWGQQRKSADRPFLQAKLGTCGTHVPAIVGERRVCAGLHCIGEDFGASDAQLAPQSLSHLRRRSTLSSESISFSCAVRCWCYPCGAVGTRPWMESCQVAGNQAMCFNCCMADLHGREAGTPSYRHAVLSGPIPVLSGCLGERWCDVVTLQSFSTSTIAFVDRVLSGIFGLHLFPMSCPLNCYMSCHVSADSARLDVEFPLPRRYAHQTQRRGTASTSQDSIAL